MRKYWSSVIFFLVFTIGVLLASAAWSNYQETQSFVATANPVQGYITAFRQSTDSDGAISYFPVISFQDETGQQHEVRASFSVSLADWNIGDAITILYDKTAPNEAIINSFSELYALVIILGIIGLIFLLVGGIGLYRGLKRILLKRWLIAHGEVIEAEVSAVGVDRSIRVNGQSPYYITCKYPDAESGVFREYKSVRLWRDPANYVKNTIKVYRDPMEHKRYYVFTDDLFQVH